jgi:Na+/H+-dicarboxylate symporter
MSGVIGGVVLGIILRNARTDKWTPREIMYINYLGDLFLRMLKSLILPLIISSLVSAIGSLDLSLSGKIGARAIGYYMVTTICAVILGERGL